ncbi:uncharacterized protein LOC111050469 [Nilaparvata lugens]|uniref:uncharacterized protein LOC111050469 n=1 Tax=Nilaparvata lugens TaxID=108931 RepID=UPI00193E11B4|nr:uncharacterized protein LOC111050469 [Nilaparvata lugens]
MACDLVALLKSCELLLCLVLFAYRVWTEWETLQVFYALEKQSREWPLANNFVRDRRNAIFTETTLGAYTLVCAGLLIGHVTGELNNARITESFLLVLGTLLFLLMGGIFLTNVDDVPYQLVSNNIILGVLAILTAILFLLDIGLHRKQAGDQEQKNFKKPPAKLQKSVVSAPKAPPEKSSAPTAEKIDEVDNKSKQKKSVMGELRSSLKKRSERSANTNAATEQAAEFHERERQQNEMQMSSRDDTLPQVGRRNMENRGFSPTPERHPIKDNHRRELDPDEFEKSFPKVERHSNGHLKNSEHHTRDERYYSDDDERHRRSTMVLEPHDDNRYNRYEYERKDLPRGNGYLKQYDASRHNEDQPRANGYLKQHDSPRNDDQRFIEHYREHDLSKEYARPFAKERRHSIDYVQKDEEAHREIMRRADRMRRDDDYFRRSEKARRSHIERMPYDEESPRFQRRREEYSSYRDRPYRFDGEDLSKPLYHEGDRWEGYRGYPANDTPKERLPEKQMTRKSQVNDENDSAMPPKHTVEVEMDDHFYKPKELHPPVEGRRSNEGDKRFEGDPNLQVSKVTSTKNGNHTGSSDDGDLIPQIPSVSFLLSERGRKVMPSLSTSPIERASTPKYYFADPSSPGYVKQQASNWPSPSPINNKPGGHSPT